MDLVVSDRRLYPLPLRKFSKQKFMSASRESEAFYYISPLPQLYAKYPKQN